MFRRVRILATTVAVVWVMPAFAQAPAPTTTAFDGRYFGTATPTVGGRAPWQCATITSVDMTITGGQAVVRELWFEGGGAIYRGSVNAAGEISALRYDQKNGIYIMVSGAIRDKTFTGQHVNGRVCYDHIQMAPAPAPTMPFDGDYIGVSRRSGGSGDKCPPNEVPAALIIRNSVVLGMWWQGTVSARGDLVIRNPNFRPVDAEIDPQGTIRGQYGGSACTVSFVWRKQAG